MAPKPSTRSLTKKTEKLPSNLDCMPSKTTSNPNPIPKIDKTESGSEPEGSKRRRLLKGKSKVSSCPTAHKDDTQELTESPTHRTLFQEFKPETISSELDKIRLTKDERDRVNRVAQYNIHGGRSYPQVWVNKHAAFQFFTDLLKFQEWEVICQHSGNIYPIEIYQFYANVSLWDGCLLSTVNGTSVSLKLDEFCSLFSIPNDGIEINPSDEWGNLSDDMKLSIKKYFNNDATLNSPVLTASFSPKEKFLFNFLWNTIVPRRGGRDKVSSYEMFIVKNWVEGVRMNLGWLVFHRIIQISKMVVEEREYTTVDLPYGLWLSHVLEVQNIVTPKSSVIRLKDEMNDTYLKFMKLVPLGSDLIFHMKSQLSPAVSPPVLPDLSSLANNMEKFMGCVLTRLDKQDKQISDLLTIVGKDKVEPRGVQAEVKTAENLNVESENAATLDEILVLLNKLVTKVETLDRTSNDTAHECFRSTLAVQNLASQGGALLISGKTVREEMGMVYDAVKALTLKIVNFDTCLTAQANHVRTCLDRLESLEYRTRPGYVNPHHPHRP